MMIDSHNHLQDLRLAQFENTVFAKSMVNGTSEEDWSRVADFAERFPDRIIPNFGLHPWFVDDCSNDWGSQLIGFLDRFPRAGIGEVGIDKWIRDHDLSVQVPIFVKQLQIAASREVPLTIHCLQAFGRLADLLKDNALPDSGFLLHSYSGPIEMVDEFVELGGYFSFSGYFMQERKTAVREVFREIPIERFLVETDAPDMPLPESENRNPLPDDVNHPANLEQIYDFAARLRGMDRAAFEQQIAVNFARFTGVD